MGSAKTWPHELKSAQARHSVNEREERLRALAHRLLSSVERTGKRFTLTRTADVSKPVRYKALTIGRAKQDRPSQRYNPRGSRGIRGESGTRIRHRRKQYEKWLSVLIIAIVPMLTKGLESALACVACAGFQPAGDTLV
jgi:hypothetical protein